MPQRIFFATSLHSLRVSFFPELFGVQRTRPYSLLFKFTHNAENHLCIIRRGNQDRRGRCPLFAMLRNEPTNLRPLLFSDALSMTHHTYASPPLHRHPFDIASSTSRKCQLTSGARATYGPNLNSCRVPFKRFPQYASFLAYNTHVHANRFSETSSFPLHVY